MKSNSTRTIAGLAAVLAAIVAIVLWKTRGASLPAAEVASAGTGTSPTEPQTLSGERSDEAGAPLAAGAPAVELDVGATAEARSAARPPSWIELIVVVVDPTKSIKDNHVREVAELFTDQGEPTPAVGPQGSYKFRVLPGRALFLLHQRGFKPVERWIETREQEPVHREEIVLEPAWTLLVNLVTSDGRDVCRRLRDIQDPSGLRERSPLAITASLDPPGQPFDFQRSMHNEWVVGFRTCAQEIDIVDDPPVHVSVHLGDRILATQRLDTRVPEVTFTIESDTIQSLMSRLVLQLTDAYTAGPVEDVKATLVDAVGGRARAKSDARGRVAFLPQAPGKYRLDLDWENRFLTSRAVDLLPGETTDLGTVALTTGVEISGSCSDANEQSDRLWDATIVPEDPDSDSPVVSHPFPVKWDGRFSTWGFAAGRYSLRVVSHEQRSDRRYGSVLGISGPVLVDTRNGRVRDLVIEMKKPSGVRLRPKIADYSDFGITLRARDGRCFWGGRLGDVPNGILVAPGAYTLTVTRLDEIVSRIPFDVGAAAVTVDVP